MKRSLPSDHGTATAQVRRLISLVLFAASASIVGLAAAKPSPAFIGVDEIKPGMKGYGLSVFRGTEPERFDVEVIDVLRDFRPSQSMIVIRTPHPLLDRARGVAGMSGSPIYIDGRLAGAYAYGWAYGTDPVVGVTPIANMLAELKRPVRLELFPGAKPLFKRPKRASAKRPSAKRPKRARLPGLRPYRGDRYVDALGSIRSMRDAVAKAQGPVGLRAASTPVMLGGLTDSAAKTVADELEGFGIVATQAGIGSKRGGPKAFVPGGAIAVQLARGDISITGVGTVTHVTDDNRVLAFGHPMLNAGAVGLPTATARILHVLVSDYRSFKIAEAARPLGTLVQDRQPAIVVDTDIEAGRFPVHVNVRGVEGAPKTEWNVEVSNSRVIAPLVTFTVLTNALTSTASDVADTVFKARTRTGIEGHGVIELEEQGFSASGAASGEALAQLSMFSLMEAAYANPFETTRITSVDVDVELEFRRDIFQIVDAFTAQTEVEPGSEIPIHIRLRRVDQRDMIRTVYLRIPRSAAGKKAQVVVAPGNLVALPRARARNFDDILKRVKERYPATSMVLTLQVPDRGLEFGGHVVDSLPASALNALQLKSSTEDGRPFTTQQHAEVPMFDVVVGGATLQLQVRKVARDRIRGER